MLLCHRLAVSRSGIPESGVSVSVNIGLSAGNCPGCSTGGSIVCNNDIGHGLRTVSAGIIRLPP